MKSAIEIIELTKSFDRTLVLPPVSLSLETDGRYCLMGPSGVGKTTFLRILMGLETADSGSVSGTTGKRFSAVFQEDRLLEGLTAMENIRLATGKLYSREELTTLCTRLLPGDSLNKPVREYSGGMKRRTAILRAILSPADIFIMDEPFTGLDHETKKTAVEMILEYTRGKLLLVTTHTEEDVSLLNARILNWRP